MTYNLTKRPRFDLKINKLSFHRPHIWFYSGQDKEVPVSHKAVPNLIEAMGVLDKGYNLYVDNWYTSPTPFHWLLGRYTNACGTVR